jgi:signal transduction histidine kinase
MLLASVGMIATLAAIGISGWLTFRRVEAGLVAQRESMARVIASHLDQQFEQMLAGLLTVGLEARETLAQPALAIESEPMRRLYLGSDQFDALLLVDGRLEVRVAVPADAARYAQDLAALRLPRGPTARPVIAARPAGGTFNHRVWAVVPLVALTGEQVGWAAGMTRTTGRRFAALADPVVSGSFGTVDLLDEAGTVLAVSAPDNLHPASHGPGVHTARATLATTSWTVVVHDDPREPNAQRLLRGWVLAIPLLTGLAVLYAWGIGRSIRAPLLALTAQAEQIAEGDLTRRVPPMADDEIGRLGRAFERMRLALRESLERIAADNAMLEQRVAERTEQLARANLELRDRERTRLQLLRKVIRAQEDERKRIARELHDETGQSLTALAVRLDVAQRAAADTPAGPAVAEARVLASRSLDEIHRLMHDLRPSVLDDLGLCAGLRWFADRRLARHGVSVRFEVSSLPDRLPPDLETALFRAAQEALTNIERHARAEHVLVQCSMQEGALTLEIEDDGEGFEPAAMVPQPGDARGLGLLGMRERVELFGGTVTIDSAPGSGTRVVISVPAAGIQPPNSHGEDARTDR